MGFLLAGPASSPEEFAESRLKSPFWLALKELGWVYGQNIVAERRWGESPDQLDAAAADLVRFKVDFLFTSGGSLAKILQLKTRIIPIVVLNAGADLVAGGLVASLARPGGNLTGSQVLQQAGVAARTLGIQLHSVVVHRPWDFASAFLDMMKARDQGLLAMSSPFMFVHRKEIVDLAAKYRIAIIYEFQSYVEAGGLMSYGVNLPEVSRRAAAYVDTIFRGIKPADLPIEQPTKLGLVINLKTAKELGLTVPQSFLARADEVIQ